MFNCSKANNEYFMQIISNLSDQVSSNLEIYYGRIKNFAAITFCIRHLEELNENSDESKFKLAYSSIKNLRKIQSECPKALRIVSDLDSLINLVYESLITILMSPSHKHFIIGIKILTNVALLNFFTNTSDQRPIACENIALGIGTLLILFNDGKVEYPTDIINEISPHINEIIHSLLDMTFGADLPILRSHLDAYIQFVNLHPFIEVTKASIDILYLNFIVSTPLKFKVYTILEDLPQNSALIGVTSFLYFLMKYKKNLNRNESDVIPIKEYFDYLLNSKLLSKTEEIIIKRFFNDF